MNNGIKLLLNSSRGILGLLCLVICLVAVVIGKMNGTELVAGIGAIYATYSVTKTINGDTSTP